MVRKMLGDGRAFSYGVKIIRRIFSLWPNGGGFNPKLGNKLTILIPAVILAVALLENQCLT